MTLSFHNIFSGIYVRMVLAGVALSASAMPATAAIDLGVGRQATVGAYIYDLKGDSVVLADNADVAMTPASVVKSFTTASALQNLGKDWRFETRVALSGSRGAKGVWNGDIIIFPGGDPTLDSENPGGKSGICDSIIYALRDMGLHTVTGSVVIADTVPDQGQAPYWENEDTPYPYGAGWFNLNWKDNTFSIWPATGKTAPHVPDLEIVKIRRRNSGIGRGTGSERLYVYGRNLKNRRRCETTTMPYPYKAFAYALRKRLGENGIDVKGRYRKEGDPATIAGMKLTPVCTYYSEPLLTIMRDLMYRSDNTFAEGVLRAQAPGASREAAVKAEIELWRGNCVDTDGQLFRDGSGLSRSTSVTPRFIGDVLGYMAKSDYRDDYVSLYARAGRDGTVRNLLKETPLAGRMALKSGSMSGVRCYAGYALDEDGAPGYVVVLFVNRYSCSGASLRTAIEKFMVENMAPRLGVADKITDDDERKCQ